jgi:hypothetical protein
MNELRAPDCKIFVEADIGDRELLGLVAGVVFAPEQALGARCEVEVLKNEDYDSKRQTLFPDGFVYFRYTIDLYISEGDTREKAALVGDLLRALWAWGFPAVAACAYEDRLPYGGGYKSRSIPWPM